MYTTAELDASLSAKADKEESYTIADLDQLLAAKADKRNTYRAIEVDDLVTQKAANESAQQTCQVCVCRRCCGAIDLKFFAPHAPWQIPLELVSISAARRSSAPLPGVHAED